MSFANRREEGRNQKEDSSERRSSEGQPNERTIVVATSSSARIPDAVGPPTTGPKFSAWSRLEHLYRISKVFAELTNIEQTMADVLALMTNIQPLRSAVLIHGTESHLRMADWSAEGVSEGSMRTAKKHAMASYEYFVGIATTLEEDPAALDGTALKPDFRTDQKNFVALPLVVGRSQIFGVLQWEGFAAFSEPDLVFLNAIANQLAVALDRHYARQREMLARAQAEEAERRMHFLAEAGKILAASLDHQSTWESIAQLATSSTTDLSIADLCIIDFLERGQSAFQRTIVLSPSLREWVTEKDVTEALADVISKVVLTGQSVIHPEVGTRTFESLPLKNSSKTSDVVSIQSYMCDPLELDGATIGTLTVGWTSPGHIYTAPDLALFHDLVLRVVVAFARGRLYRNAVAAVRSRDDLLSIVSHDLRAPLAVILGFTNIFLRAVRPGEPVSCDPRHIQTIERSATQMTRLIEDLLITASIEAEHVVIERQLIAVGPFINEVLELMQPLAARKDIQLKTEAADHISPIFADRERTIQVFANLIGNAIKFSPAGGVITLRAVQVEDSVQFSVEDNGPGIPEDKLGRVFDRFWQAPETARSGMGLGLFIVKGIVEAHAGKVWARSKVGAGTTFLVTLPRNQPG